jgi:hypothetical protein
MQLTFLGAARTVTGSRYLVEAEGRRILVDCGLFQGHKELRLRNWAPFPVSPGTIDAVVLTHAHIDHAGSLPLLVRQGFGGPIYCTRPTRDLCALLLPDSGHLQEEDARRANRHGYSKHDPALPLYTAADAEAALARLRIVPFGHDVALGDGIRCRFERAGHILGAAWVAWIRVVPSSISGGATPLSAHILIESRRCSRGLSEMESGPVPEALALAAPARLPPFQGPAQLVSRRLATDLHHRAARRDHGDGRMWAPVVLRELGDEMHRRHIRQINVVGIANRLVLCLSFHPDPVVHGNPPAARDRPNEPGIGPLSPGGLIQPATATSISAACRRASSARTGSAG